MLVLARKAAQTIRIGDDVVIKVIKTGSGTVKLGIDAPNDVRVIRGELVEMNVAEPAPTVANDAWTFGGVQSDQFPHVA
ncbi:MAG: carbon storage regulator [Fuerstiella sp.]|nr:carbon storage regulator [Fuerstiella sp.]